MKPKTGPHVLILDLKPVTFVSSEALGRLLSLKKRVRAAEGRLLLCNARDVMKVFEVPGIHEILNISQGEPQPPGEKEGPVCRFAPSGQILDGPAATELENRYERWWHGSGQA
jgi:hypothetical protein